MSGRNEKHLDFIFLEHIIINLKTHFYSNIMLKKSIVVYQTNDQEGTVRISTVGENVQCSIQVFHI